MRWLLIACLALVQTWLPAVAQTAQDRERRVEKPAPVRAIVLPEGAFLEALSGRHYEVDRGTAAAAARLAGALNAPGVVEVRAAIGKPGVSQRFSGTIFLVVRDAAYIENGKQVASRDHYVAAVELQGQSPWVGTSAMVISDPVLTAAGSSLGSCCGASTVCIPDKVDPSPCDPQPHPFPDGPFGKGFCTGPDVAVTSTVPPQQTLRSSQGGPVVKFQVFASGVGPAGTLFEGSCSDRTLDPKCGVATPNCEPGDVGFEEENGSANVDIGSACSAGTKPVTGRDMPEWCTYARFEGPSAAECRGPRWEPMVGGEGIRGSVDRAAEEDLARALSDDFVPPMCLRARVTEDSNICTSARDQQQKKELEQAMLRAQFGFLGGRDCKSTGRVVNNQWYSFELLQCVACEPGPFGKCKQWTEEQRLDVAKECRKCEFGPEEVEGSRDLTPVPDRPTFGPIPTVDPDPEAPNHLASGGGPQNTNSNTPQSPGKDNKKPDSNQSTKGSNNLNKPEKKRDGSAGDPVLLGDGSFDLSHVDLSFPGPTRPLEFARFYNSRSDDQGTLGSNWTHNWDTWIEPLNQFNTPEWAMPYCLGTDPGLVPRFSSLSPNSDAQVTCVMLHWGDGSAQLFFLDLGTRLYMPTAGRTDTLVTTTEGGWAVRSREGHRWLFNRDGHLIEDRDRFGNGFHIDHEPTPLWEMYRTYCSAEALVQRNETKHARRCAYLAHLLGDGPPVLNSGWTLEAADYPLPALNPFDTAAMEARARLRYGRAQLLHLVGLGAHATAAYGKRRMRPIKVTDDLGRSLQFTYTHVPRCPPPSICAVEYDFAATPHADLLESVTGPAGTALQFQYSAVPQSPIDFGERFLTSVVRTDSVTPTDDVRPAARRSYTYHYQWPGGPVPSFEGFGRKVFLTYRDFYRTFMRCSFAPLSPCGERGKPQVAAGDPDYFARSAQYRYMSDVVDNIIRVDDTPSVQGSPTAFLTTPSIQSETRYEHDPWSTSFDRVYAQRYGSSLARQDPKRIAPDEARDSWQSGLPKATFTKVAKPQLLPDEIQKRYPLERTPPFKDASLIPGAVGHTDPSIGACNYGLTEKLRATLPGWREPIPYFNATVDARKGGRLYTTPLTCEQLTIATYGDPTHNDLVSELEPIRNTPESFDHIVKRISGRRPVIAADGNRICAWNEVVDRNGDKRFYGMNFRGQIMVEAVRENHSRGFIFTETLYNADGMVFQQRRPMRGTNPWQASDGYTQYRYDEIDPVGSKGWDEWLPVFWARRMNLLRGEEHAKGSTVLNFDEAQGVFTHDLGRYRQFAYEPLFNQLRKSETGTLTPKGDVRHEQTTYIFDYQELVAAPNAPPDRSLSELLRSLTPWGFAWAADKSGALDFQLISSWQLPLIFHGTDLNGDGAFGFRPGNRTFDRGRGVPILAVHEGNDPKASRRIFSFGWAPHGQLAFVYGPEGELTEFFYYPHQSATTNSALMFGATSPPTDKEIGNNYSGLLARTRTLRFDRYSTSNGPNSKPCPLLPGPYQWLLPENCTAPEPQLQALGFPPQAVQEILAASQAVEDRSRPAAYETHSFSYNELGGVRFSWQESRRAHVVRDTDGRPLVVTDPIETTTRHRYSVKGFLEATEVNDASGELLSQEIRAHDENGQLVYHCAAEAPQGCDVRPPVGAERKYTYTPEEALESATDPEGAVRSYRYNERGLLTHERLAHPQVPQEGVETTYRYDADGDLTRIQYAPGTPVQLTESFSYDGLRRLTQQIDRRGYAWQTAYTQRDHVARRKRDDVSYRLGSTPVPKWETAFSYDGNGLVTESRHNGIRTARLRRTAGGRAFGQSAGGIGETLVTFDLRGRPMWSRSPDGSETVMTYRASDYEQTISKVRRSGVDLLTTATITTFDASGRPTDRIQYGSGDERRTSVSYTGKTTTHVGPDGVIAKTRYDMLGLLRESLQQRSGGTNPQFDRTLLDYNRRGQLIKLSDPANQVSSFKFDSLGRLKERNALGQPQVFKAFTYDALSRVDVETVGQHRILHVYDTKGDPWRDVMLGGPAKQVIAERFFDDLGRLRKGSFRNPALLSVPAARRTVVTALQYDGLGRVASEVMRVGQEPGRRVTSMWSVNGGTWQRKVRYALGASSSEWTDDYDPALRLVRKESTPSGSSRTEFFWLGEIYRGRRQTQLGLQSPFTEKLLHDNFGAPLSWRYKAIDLDSAQQPISSSDGMRYCGGAWNTVECGRPLMESQALRDVTGRIVSLNRTFGHPLFRSNNLVSRLPLVPWRGYAYDDMGRLKQLWEHAGNAGGVQPVGLRSHSVTAIDIESIAISSDPWSYEREVQVGGTLSIRNGVTNVERWALQTPRGAGHQIQQLRVGGQTRHVQHDAMGHVTVDGSLKYSFDPRGQLATVSRSGGAVESYLYDIGGRLIAVLSGASVQPEQTFTYDGVQMVAAFAPTGRPLWEAHWGPNIDGLIGWRDLSGATTNYIPLTDNVNSVVAMWDSSTARIRTTASYDPDGRIELHDENGNLICSELGTGNICAQPGDMPFSYASAWRSYKTGLVYMRNRWYSPALTQFVSPDPIGYPDSYNAYAFAGFDPVNRRDPFGLCTPGSGVDPSTCVGVGTTVVSTGAAWWGGWAGTAWGGVGYAPAALPSASAGAATTGTAVATTSAAVTVTAAAAAAVLVVGTALVANAWIDSPLSFPGVPTEPRAGTPGPIDPPTSPAAQPNVGDPPSAGTPDVPIGDPRGPATVGRIGDPRGPATGVRAGGKQGEAIEDIDDLIKHVEEHLETLWENPFAQEVPHWRDEVNTALDKMENKLKYLGKKSYAEWRAKIDGWRNHPAMRPGPWVVLSGAGRALLPLTPGAGPKPSPAAAGRGSTPGNPGSLGGIGPGRIWISREECRKSLVGCR